MTIDYRGVGAGREYCDGLLMLAEISVVWKKQQQQQQQRRGGAESKVMRMI